MSMIVGYRLLGPQDEVVAAWGGVWGQCPGLPAWLDLPSGDRVGAPALDQDYQGCRLVAWEMEEPPPPVPEAISDRQFAQVLALRGIITRAEAIAWAARGDLPEALANALAGLEDQDQLFAAEMLLSSATTYERHHPLVAVLAAELRPGGYSDAELNTLWAEGAGL